MIRAESDSRDDIGEPSVERRRERVTEIEIMNRMPAAGVKDLRLKFPGEAALLFRDLGFTVSPGEKVLLLGPSGCGKSTLLQVLSGMIPRVVEVPMKCEEQHIPESWAYVFQDPDTQFCMPYVDEELAFVLENLSVPRREMTGRIEEALASVGLQLPDLHTPISGLSQGMKQRLALASALLLQPKVLFLDEPSALLDPEGRRQIWETIKSLSPDITMIIVEHRIEEIAEEVDRVVLFGPDGVILGEGSPSSVFSRYRQELIDYGIWYPGVWEDYAQSPEGKKAFSPLASSCGHIGMASPRVGSVSEDRIPVIELEGCTVFRRSQPVTDVARAYVHAGDFIAVTGPNGAGKSTLLLGLAGLLPVEGRYMLAGERIEAGSKKEKRRLRERMLRHIGFVFQNPEFQFVTERVLDEIAYSFLVDGTMLEEAEQQAMILLERFGLKGLENRHPYQLSAGQKRRLSVATAMTRQPDVLMLDEPTFGQDARNTFAILEMCEELRQAGTAILMVTHEMNIAERAATHIWEVSGGAVVSQRASSRIAADHLPQGQRVGGEVLGGEVSSFKENDLMPAGAGR